jgi:hypothetical protein
MLSKEEAYQQISHKASLFRAVLRYVEREEGIGMRFGVLPIYGILESRLHQRFSKTQVAIS